MILDDGNQLRVSGTLDARVEGLSGTATFSEKLREEKWRKSRYYPDNSVWDIRGKFAKVEPVDVSEHFPPKEKPPMSEELCQILFKRSVITRPLRGLLEHPDTFD